MQFKQLYLVGILLFGIFAISGCSRNDQTTLQGYIEGQFTYISSQITGTLENLTVERGSPIKIGQKLAMLESSPQLEQYHKVQADLQQAQANLADLQKGQRPSEIAAIEDQQKQVIAQINFANKTVKRYQHLVKTNYLQQSELDKAVSDYNNLNAQLAEINENLITAKLPARIDQINAAKAQVTAAEAALQQTQWQLKQKQLSSPLNGYVYDTFYRTGETVPANSPILSALDPKNVFVIFFVPETQLANIKIGQKINFTYDGYAQPIPATIYFISDKAEFTPPIIYSEISRSKLTFRVEAKLTYADAQQVHPGQPITIHLANAG